MSGIRCLSGEGPGVPGGASGDGAAARLSEIAAAVPTAYTEAINWGDQMVMSGEFNADGEMIIEYYFEPPTGRFLLFPRLEWTAYEKQQVELAFDIYETFLNVEFVETATRDDAEFKLNKINAGSLLLGVMNPPGEPNPGAAGFNAGPQGIGWDEGFLGLPVTGGLEPGGFGFITLIHEFGHGLGLAHPHDNGGGSTILPGVDDASDSGTGDLNQGVYTTMSYVDGWATHPSGPLTPGVAIDYGYQATPMALDIAVLQDRYGANTGFASGDTTYILPDANVAGTFFSAIWDTGGTDAIAYTGSRRAMIDLRPATLELEVGGGGRISYAEGIYGGYTIANGVDIEQASGGSGNDWLIGNALANLLLGNHGFDRIEGGPGGDTLRGGTQADTLLGGEGDDSLFGEDGNDRLFGEDGNDTVEGGEGDDTAFGGPGDDTIRGGTQEDDLFGDAGADALFGDAGFDLIDGGEGDDDLHGGAQADNLFGRAGQDTMFGDDGFDRLFGGDGDDTGHGGEGTDTLFGEAGDDTLFGDTENDSFWGGTGNDTAFGGAGDDVLRGGSGFDVLNGGAGDDTYRGNFNADTFVFEGAFGTDTIEDFEEFNDFEKIDLSGVATITDFSDLVLNHMTQVGADVLIDDKAGNTILVENAALSDMNVEDFSF